MRAALFFVPALGAIATSSAIAQTPTVIEVRLSNFRFSPEQIVLEHGRPYVLRLVNAGSGGHDFTAKTFFNAASVAPNYRRWVAEGEVEVPGRQVREIRLTAPRAGTYKLKCSHTLHKAFGMSGVIVVR